MDSPVAAMDSPLVLACGTRLRNRLAKAAMTESLADDFGRSTPELDSLYALWAAGGCGLLVTGNVQVDRRYVERPGNVCIDGPQSPEALSRLTRLALAAKGGTDRDGSTVVLAQVSHAGRQSNGMVNLEPVGPGDVPMTELPSGFFGRPTALAATEVVGVVERFAHAARVCRDCGFDGVQIHAAHGYLLSSFLNPLANNRERLFGAADPYGGALEKRARPLLETVRAVRRACGSSFCVSVKLNSADFQRGGFETAEAAEVAVWLKAEGVDLLEISGGNYESGIYQDDAPPPSHEATSTRKREAYFLNYALRVQRALEAAPGPRLPCMVTGGWRSAKAMTAALGAGDCDVIGLGRPLCGDPDGPNKLLDGTLSDLPRYEDFVGGWTATPWLKRVPVKLVAFLPLLGPQSWYYRSIFFLATTGHKAPVAPFKDILANQLHEYRKASNLQGVACRGSVHDGLPSTGRRGPATSVAFALALVGGALLLSYSHSH